MLKVINILIVITLVMILFLISFLDTKLDEKRKSKILLFFLMLFIIFLGYRDIGLDLEPYRNIFNNQIILNINEIIGKGIFSSKLEPFFVLIISLLKKYNFGFKVFLFISGGIPMIIIYTIIKKVEKRYSITTFLLFLLMFFFRGPVDVIRHFFAATIYLSAILSLSKDKKNKYWIKTILSIFIHYSNIIIVFIKPFLKIKWNKNKFYISMIITIIIAFFSRVVLTQISGTSVFNTDNIIFWKFEYYLTYYNTMGYQYIGNLHKVLLSIMTNFPWIFSFFITLLALNKIQLIRESSFKSMILSSQIMGILIAIFFIILKAPTLGIRLQFLLSIGSFFIVKDVMLIYANMHNKAVYISIIFSLIFYNFIIILYYAGVHDPMSPFYILASCIINLAT